MAAAIVLRRDLDVPVTDVAVHVLVFDADVGEVDVAIGLYDTLPISRTCLSASPLSVRSIPSKVNR
jgi:hypothetical protein